MYAHDCQGFEPRLVQGGDAASLEASPATLIEANDAAATVANPEEAGCGRGDKY